MPKISEKIARHYILQEYSGKLIDVLFNDNNSQDSMYDLKAEFSNGGKAAIEVTTLINEDHEEFLTAVLNNGQFHSFNSDKLESGYNVSVSRKYLFFKKKILQRKRLN